jgi:hypothetical protein
VRVVPGVHLAHCIFCGLPARLTEVELITATVPSTTAPPALDASTAAEHFRSWSRSWWLAPVGLAHAMLELELVLVPALRMAGEVESHWTGVRKDPTRRSGRAPAAGIETSHVADAFVAASSALTRRELTDIGDFGDLFEPFEPATCQTPWEAGRLSDRMASRYGHAALLHRHREQLRQEHALDRVASSGRVLSFTTAHVLVPVYVGTFQLRGAPWRLLVNGVTGKVVGTRPVSRLKTLLGAAMLSMFVAGPCATLSILAVTAALWSLGVVDD